MKQLSIEEVVGDTRFPLQLVRLIIGLDKL